MEEVVIPLNENDEAGEEMGFVTGKPKEALSDEARRKKAILAVAFYWVTSLSLVFLNKVIMVGDVTNLDAPLFMSWTQFAITVVFIWILGIVGRYFKPFSFFPPFEYKIEKAKKVLPLTFVFLGMIVFNNLCLKYVEVSFYQVARSLTIVFNVVFTYTLLGKTTNRNTLICCLVIIVGYLMGCDGEVRFSVVGVIFGVLSSVFVALNSIYVKKILPVVEENSEKLMMYNNLNAVIILPIFIFLFTDEAAEISLHQKAFMTMVFWVITIIAGLFGFLINFASYIQIKYTSPLSHNVSGTAKAAAQTVIALMVFRNPVTLQGIVGIIVVILGSFAYSRMR